VIKTLSLALVAVGCIVAAGFAFRKSSESSETRDFLTHQVQKGRLEVKVSADGTLESSANIEIKCNVKGGSTVLWVIETGTTVQPNDVLVELDRSDIEDKVLQQKIEYEKALANKLISESDVAVARTSIHEYLEGTYKEEHATIEKDIFDAEQAVRKAELSHQSAMRLTAKGTLRPVQLDGEAFSLESARKDLELKQNKLSALEKYTREKMVQELESALKAAQAKLAADEAALELEQQRLAREKQQLENCTIKSTGSGLVIFPSAAAWKDTPDIEEGATVREQQTLLMIPDLSKMQVKVGIHESKVERLKKGMSASVQLQGNSLNGQVESIAEVTRPAGWWTGNMVKYDTIIKLDPREGLKPGMSAIVEIVLAQYDNVITAPVASIVEANSTSYCWVSTAKGVERRHVVLGDTNDEFTIIKSGLTEGEAIVLSPLSSIEDAQRLVAQNDAKAAKVAAPAAEAKGSATVTGNDS
jgi:multidrug efflux pump subunit AcrA (membrane-fusion protein)